MWAQSALDVGRIIAAARRHAGMSQTGLARAVGVTQNWISEVENGKDTAQIGRVLRVLSFFKVRLEVSEAPWLKRAGGPPARGFSVNLSNVLAAHLPRAARAKKKTR